MSLPAEQLLKYHNIGFKLLPLGDDNKPEIAWTPIYENPDYWTPETLTQQSYKFKNIATVFGKSRLKVAQARISI